jgi:hypothetical protein
MSALIPAMNQSLVAMLRWCLCSPHCIHGRAPN